MERLFGAGEPVGGVVNEVAKGLAKETEGVFEEVVSVLRAEEELDVTEEVALS